MSVFFYTVSGRLGSPANYTSSTDALDNTFGPVSDTDALLERMAYEETSSTDFNLSDLQKISEDLQTFDLEQLRKAFQSTGLSPYTSSLHSIQEMLCEYLVEQSPVAALASIVWFEEHRVENLLRIMARHLAHRDLEESLKLTAGLKQPYRDIALETMLGELDLTDDVMSTLLSFNNAEIANVIAEQEHKQRIYESINEDPITAFDLLLTDDIADSEQTDLFSQILNELFHIEGLDALKRFDFVNNFQRSYTEMIVPFVAQDRIGTLNYLEQLSQYQRTGIMYPFMENWVEFDVENALDTVRTLTNPSFRSSAFRTLLSAWGRTRPLEVIERLEEIPRKHRYSAVVTVVNTLAATSPDEILRLLPSLKAIPGAFNNEIERAFVYRWSSTYPAQALDWVRENIETESVQRDRMLNWVLGEYALVQPEKAMEVAISEDPNPAQGELGLTHTVIDALIQNGQLEAAIGLLDQVPKSNRVYTYAGVAEKLVLENRFNDVVSISEVLPETDRAAYFRWVVRKLSDTHSSEVLTLIAKIPDTLIRTEVVNQTLEDTWAVERYFTEKQLETLRSLVAE